MQKVSNKGDTDNHFYNQNTVDSLADNSERSSSSNDLPSIIEYYLIMVVSRVLAIDRIFGLHVNGMGELQISESKVEFLKITINRNM